MTTGQTDNKRNGSGAGVAIGPILFILAVLALLAAAIATSIEEPASASMVEGNRTKALALMRIGENLKFGMDRIVLGNGLSPTAVDTNVSDTASSNQLFSPTGGGIAPPSTSMANNPLVDKWYCPQGPIAGFGVGGASKTVLAVLPISLDVCAEINNKSVGAAVVPVGAALGDFAASPGVVSAPFAQWPTTPKLVSVSMGCVNNTSVTVSASGPTSPYFFYQVLAIQ